MRLADSVGSGCNVHIRRPDPDLLTLHQGFSLVLCHIQFHILPGQLFKTIYSHFPARLHKQDNFWIQKNVPFLHDPLTYQLVL
jgi:hypothetical protein